MENTICIIENLNDIKIIKKQLNNHPNLKIFTLNYNTHRLLEKNNISHKIAATLNSTGAPTVVLNSQNALHGDLGIVSNEDTIIALSYSGETNEILDLLPALRRFKVNIISMTGNTNSSLGRNSDIILNTKVDREACPLNLAPTSSTTAMLVLGDALAMTLLESRGFVKEDFAKEREDINYIKN